jgi:hypothetical protein
MALEITDERVAAAASKLHQGGWSYSARQLYYAACAEAETGPIRVASGEVGLGVLLILVGAITGQRILLEVLGIIGLVLVVVGAVTRVQERRPLLWSGSWRSRRRTSSAASSGASTTTRGCSARHRRRGRRRTGRW